MDALLDHFSDLEDPRCPGKTRYRLTDILLIAVCAVIAGAESYEDIALYGRSKLHWLNGFLDLPAGIPSHDTFRRVFMLIDAAAFEACFQAWATSQAASTKGEVVALDGKTARGSFDRRREMSPLHVVSAWATEQSLVLAQRVVDEKSNEIAVLPKVLDALQLEGVLVTTDAMGCQKEVAERIVGRKADYLLALKSNYLLALKSNHQKAYEATRTHFEHFCFGRSASTAALPPQRFHARNARAPALRRVRRQPWPLGAAAGLFLWRRCRTGGTLRVARSEEHLGRGRYP